jgi:branched-chain amino acid transport system permease protein
MDVAAELMGIRLLRTKLLAFAVSSFYCGVAGAAMVFLWLGAAEASSFGTNVSFQVLFMVVIGGAGSLLGSFMGAAFLWILPIVIRAVPQSLGLAIAAERVEQVSFMLVGGLIILVLILEPHGMAGLWQIAKQRLRTWPFPY